MSGGISPILIGGLVPAFLFGLGSTLQRGSNVAGITPSIYLAFLSIGFVAAAVLLSFIMPHQILSVQGCLLAGLNGLVWGAAYSLMMFTLSRSSISMAKLIPLVNMNTLVTVLLCLWIFAEWKQISVPGLLVGSLLIIVGGTIVASS